MQKVMSALTPKADMCGATRYVRFVPIADIGHYSITSSARASTAGGIVESQRLSRLEVDDKLDTSSAPAPACLRAFRL